MRKKLCWMLLTAALLLAVAMAGVGRASPEPIIQVEPEDNTGEPGETFSVDITATDVVISEASPVSNGLYTWEAWMIFDPDVIHAVNATRGPFLRDAVSPEGYTTVFFKKIDNSSGFVRVGEGIWPKAPPDPKFPPAGATGSGTLATITFQVKAEGATSILFETPKEVAKTNLYTVVADTPVKLSYTAKDGAFDNRKFVLSTELIVAIVAVVVIVCAATVFFYRRRKASAGT
jgi:hypothetical protein